MKQGSVRQIILNNTTGDIVEVDLNQRNIKFFKDPFGRDSSGVPEWQCTFQDLSQPNNPLLQLKSQFYPHDWNDLQEMIAPMPDGAV